MLIEVGRHFSLFVLYRSSGDFQEKPVWENLLSCWEKSLDSLSVLYQSLEDLCGFGRLFVFRWWSSVLDLLGEISAPLVGLWKLSAPSLLSLVLVGVGILFSRCHLRIRTFLGKNLFIRKTRG